ncbi:MAG: TPM domain-containing protein [Pyrinomonadaceae bacterium]|nr:TPM domain-containing protein [Pyrinomonadaceae bacterium]
MKRNFLPRQFKPLLIILAILIAGLTVFSQENQPWSQNTSPLPPPTGFVNDYAGVIDSATKQALETKLKNLKDTTNPSVEIAVAVVKTTGERAIFDYSLAVARGWKIGSVDDDNPSALLLIAIDDRKYFTQVSKDLEDELPDGVVGSLQRQFLVPEFKKANYAKGISDTIDAYIATIRNKGNTSGNANTVKPASNDGDSGGAFFGLFCCAGIILIVIVILIASRNHKGGGPSAGDRNRWGGGGFGGGGGGSSGSDIASAVIGGIIGAALSGGSSSSSSDSGSSGGGDWGGFGGGGDFGGGGAGGDW